MALACGVTVAVRRAEGCATRRGALLTPRNPHRLEAMFRISPRRGSSHERLESRVASDATVRWDMKVDARHFATVTRC
jgi:hypothetical protein